MMAGGPACIRKTGGQTVEAERLLNPFSFRWRQVSITYPAEVFLTTQGELYVVVKSYWNDSRLPSLLGVRLFGPIDPEKDVKEQLSGAGPFMQFDQTRRQMWRVFMRINSMEKAFEARVGLDEFKANFQEALKAIQAGDEKALRRVCPEPAFSD